jgi:hypothetical protein
LNDERLQTIFIILTFAKRKRKKEEKCQKFHVNPLMPANLLAVQYRSFSPGAGWKKDEKKERMNKKNFSHCLFFCKSNPRRTIHFEHLPCGGVLLVKAGKYVFEK